LGTSVRCSGLRGIAGAGGRGEPAVLCVRGAGTWPGAADARQRLGASATAHPALLTRNGSSAAGSAGAPRAGGHASGHAGGHAGGHADQSQVPRAREQGRSRAGAGSSSWAGQEAARCCPCPDVQGLTGRGAQGRTLAGHSVSGHVPEVTSRSAQNQAGGT